MNRFKGIIKEIETSGSLSLVKVDVQDTLFSTIIIDTIPLMSFSKSAR